MVYHQAMDGDDMPRPTAHQDRGRPPRPFGRRARLALIALAAVSAVAVACAVISAVH